MKKLTLLFLIILSICPFIYAQHGSTVTRFHIDNKIVIDARNMDGVYQPQILKRVLPKPNAGADKATIKAIKAGLEHFRQSNTQSGSNHKVQNADAPVLLRNFQGNVFNGFVPNDNDVAISNDDQVCSVTNVSIWSKDQTNNQQYGTFSIHSITSSLGLQQEEFDPKIMYDPVSNRFVFVCLNGFTDSTSNVLVGFSQDSTSYSNWNFYSLPGNPLNNSLWTDFPMMALTDDELFITVNLLYNDSTWQAGFNETIIWQIDKNEGYNGIPLNPLLHSDIEYNNEPLRNLCPAKGGSTLYGPNMYFLSNRNFTAGNDTIFLVEVTGNIASNPTTQVTPVISNVEYRMPIDAEQPFVDLLIVNDARVLGAFYENDKVQFVFNMLDTISGKDAIYHGVMDVSGLPTLSSNLYINDTLYLAYPNIAYAGLNNTDNTAVVSVLMSSPTVQPGTAAFKYDGNGLYSPLTIVKSGVSYTNMLAGNERWGDYTGCQTRYNIPGEVWVNGSFSLVNHTTRTWIGELSVNAGVSVPEINSPVSQLELYPNPAQHDFTIDFKNDCAGMVHVNLFDIGGKKVAELFRGSLIAGDNTFAFNASNLTSGTYNLVITGCENKTFLTKKLVIN